MYVGGPLFGGEAFINNTWQTPGRLFKGGAFIRTNTVIQNYIIMSRTP